MAVRSWPPRLTKAGKNAEEGFQPSSFSVSRIDRGKMIGVVIFPISIVNSTGIS
jgi:hypothetical protein